MAMNQDPLILINDRQTAENRLAQARAALDAANARNDRLVRENEALRGELVEERVMVARLTEEIELLVRSAAWRLISIGLGLFWGTATFLFTWSITGAAVVAVLAGLLVTAAAGRLISIED